MQHAPTPSSTPCEIVRLDDPDAGLEGVIVLHSTRLGPAAGGCRIWPYADMAEATADALRLAEGMTYKNALAGLPFGGGKAVIRRPAGAFDRGELPFLDPRRAAHPAPGVERGACEPQQPVGLPLGWHGEEQVLERPRPDTVAAHRRAGTMRRARRCPPDVPPCPATRLCAPQRLARQPFA